MVVPLPPRCIFQHRPCLALTPQLWRCSALEAAMAALLNFPAVERRLILICGVMAIPHKLSIRCRLVPNCTITDSAGCTRDAFNVITQPTALGDTHDSTQVSCPGETDGTITVYAYGGTYPYAYAVTQDGVNFINTTDSSITGLAAGEYTILITDAHGCTILDSARVLSPIPDSFSLAVTPTSCYGSQYQDGSITITPLVLHNAPFQFSIDSGPMQNSGLFTGLRAGQHVIDAVNFFGCSTILDTSVPSPLQAFASVMPKDTTLKLGESIQLSSAFVPYPDSVITSYQWIPSTGLSCADCADPVVTTYSHVNEYTLVITYNGICTGIRQHDNHYHQ